MNTEGCGSTEEEHGAHLREGSAGRRRPQRFMNTWSIGNTAEMRGENRREGILTAKLAKPTWDHMVLLGGSEFSTLEAHMRVFS